MGPLVYIPPEDLRLQLEVNVVSVLSDKRPLFLSFD
jgi:hypothetical protein